MSIVYQSRVFLIRLAKVFPFLLCAIVCLSYCESLYSLICEQFAICGDATYLKCPISWAIGNYMTYDWYTIIVGIILSVAFETCVWNKLSLLYLCVNLYEKDYFVEEMGFCCIVAVCCINIAISSYFIYKGIKTFT